MRHLIFLLFIFNLLFSNLSFGQINYPFTKEGNNNLQAYWYNIPSDSVKNKDNDEIIFNFVSLLQIYGPVISSSFKIQAEVYSASGKNCFDRTFHIPRSKTEDDYTVDIRDGFFKIECPVKKLPENPYKIVIAIKSGFKEYKREIKCRYHKLSGKITYFNGEPAKAFLAICPDAFLEKNMAGVWSDSSGNYEIELPERIYNAITCFYENYMSESKEFLETWAWHIIMDSDENLDFKVGTCEIYNLNAWVNNGGANIYFISFRPIDLNLARRKKGDEYVDMAPYSEKEDIIVKVNGRNVKILSLQKYYETGTRTAYLLQVDRNGLERIGKQTVSLEYNKKIEIDEKSVESNGIGYFQFYLNFRGLSKYH